MSEKAHKTAAGFRVTKKGGPILLDDPALGFFSQS